MNALLLLLLTVSPTPPPGSPTAPPPATSGFSAFAELGPEYFDHDVFALIEPGVAYDGEALQVELAAPLRFYLVRASPHYALGPPSWKTLRAEDWDERSELGQILKSLKLTAWEGAFKLRAGALSHVRLGHGTIVNDYSNDLHPDHRQAGTTATLAIGAVSATAIVSNLLATRLFAGSVTLEPLSILGPQNDRLHLLVSGAVDLAETRDAAPPNTLGLGVDVAALRTSTLKLAPYFDANLAGRNQAGGLHAGLLADLTLGSAELSFKLEWRRAFSGYLPEYFDATYEVERFVYSAAASDSDSKASAVLPTANGYRGEISMRLGPVKGEAALSARPGGGGDASLLINVEQGPLQLAAFIADRGFLMEGHAPTVFALSEVRYRLTDQLYGWAAASQRGREQAAFFFTPTDGPPIPVNQFIAPVRQLGAGIGGSLGR